MKLVKLWPKRWLLEIPDEARKILHRVGLAMFAFGLLDIGVMIYCLANDISYSSSFNIFAVISGIYLWRGHPWYVKWVTRAAGFYAAAVAALHERAGEIVSGTISVAFETDPAGNVRRRTKVTKLDIKRPDGRSETQTVTETLERRPISRRD